MKDSIRTRLQGASEGRARYKRGLVVSRGGGAQRTHGHVLKAGKIGAGDAERQARGQGRGSTTKGLRNQSARMWTEDWAGHWATRQTLNGEGSGAVQNSRACGKGHGGQPGGRFPAIKVELRGRVVLRASRKRAQAGQVVKRRGTAACRGAPNSSLTQQNWHERWEKSQRRRVGAAAEKSREGKWAGCGKKWGGRPVGGRC